MSVTGAIDDPQAEQLLAESRSRTRAAPRDSELLVELAMAASLLACAVAMAALLPTQREVVPVVSVALVALYALARHIGFEVGTGFTCPLVLVLVPMLFLVPLPLVPLHVALGLVVADLASALRGRRHPERALLVLGQSWHAVGPALVFYVAGVTAPDLGDWPLYVAAFGALVCFDAAVSLLADRFGLGAPLGSQLRPAAWVYGVDLMLAPVGLMAAFLAVESPAALGLLLPLMVLLKLFGGERSERLDRALELSQAYRGTALLLGAVIESDHEYTGSHSRDVVELSLAVGVRLGLDARRLRDLEFGALLHDVGKIAVPNEIINKPGPLDDDEWAVMKRHTVEGQKMLDSVGGVLGGVGRIVRASHEDFDGTGYPDGLAGEAIPIEARICSACDAFSAMTTDRSYRKSLGQAAALAELRRCAGSQFDPRVVDALCAVIEEGG